MWSIIGLTINRPLIEQDLGQKITANWELLFDANNRQKLADCGISIINAPLELYTIMYDYQGKSLSSASLSQIDSTQGKLQELKSHAKYIISLRLLMT